jgi:hypothetical protein
MLFVKTTISLSEMGVLPVSMATQGLHRDHMVIGFIPTSGISPYNY